MYSITKQSLLTAGHRRDHNLLFLIIEKYGKNKKIAWQIKTYPLVLHPKQLNQGNKMSGIINDAAMTVQYITRYKYFE